MCGSHAGRGDRGILRSVVAPHSQIQTLPVIYVLNYRRIKMH